MPEADAEPSEASEEMLQVRVSASASVALRVRLNAVGEPSSLIVTVVVAPSVMTGASLTAVTLTFTWTAVAEASDPSQALTVKASSVPLALAAGVQTRVSPLESSVVPGTTATPPFVRVPEDTASTRKLKASPSTSASLAAEAIIA